MNYKDIKTPQDLLNYMNDNITYGYIDINNKSYIDTSKKEYTDNWYSKGIVQANTELLKTKIGTCYDQVELARKWFLANNYEVKTFFLYFELPYINNYPTHTIIYYKEKKKLYLFESAFEMFRGIHIFNNEEELITTVKNNLVKYIINMNIGSKEDISILQLKEYSKVNNNISIKEYLTKLMQKKNEN